MPFRQQAATVLRIKETSAEQLDELTKSIREIESTISRKQAELKQRVGETYLRGDDLKQYVNMLKAKSSVYKKQRAELSALEVSFFLFISVNITHDGNEYVIMSIKSIHHLNWVSFLVFHFVYVRAYGQMYVFLNFHLNLDWT